MSRFVFLFVCALAPTVALGQQPAPNRLYRKECKDGVCSMQYVGSEWEYRIVDLVNAERRKHGLRPLKAVERLMPSARSWSRTQANSRRMYHSSGLGVGENVAWNQRGPEEVMTAWLNSPGHRRNILSPSYTEIGVGVVMAGSSPYYTQHFK